LLGCTPVAIGRIVICGVVSPDLSFTFAFVCDSV
jgi:hypothetical protein